MEFPYPSEDLHGITFGYDNIIEFPYAVEDLKGVTFGFDDEMETVTERHVMMEPIYADQPVETLDEPIVESFGDMEWNPWVSPRLSNPKDDSIVNALNERGLMRLQFERCSIFVKASCVTLPRPKNIVLRGGGRPNKDAKNRLNLDAIAPYLNSLCTEHNRNNLKPDGPYGQCLVMLKLKNTARLRKRIYMTWRRQKETTKKTDKNIMPGINSFEEVGIAMRRHINQGNENNLGADGPYGNVAGDLGRVNTKKERLGLYVIWRENRGNVKVSIDDILNVTPGNEKINESRIKQRNGKRNLPKQGPSDFIKKAKLEDDNKNKDLTNLEVLNQVEKSQVNQSDTLSNVCNKLSSECMQKNDNENIVDSSLNGITCRPEYDDTSSKTKGSMKQMKCTKHIINTSDGNERSQDSTKNEKLNFESKTENKTTNNGNVSRIDAKSKILNQPYKSEKNTIPTKVNVSKKGKKATSKLRNRYCICGSNERNWASKGAMVQCDICSQWYHFACLNIEKCEAPDTGKPFVCGFNNCKSLTASVIASNVVPSQYHEKLDKNIEHDDDELNSEKEIFISKLGLMKVNLHANTTGNKIVTEQLKDKLHDEVRNPEFTEIVPQKIKSTKTQDTSEANKINLVNDLAENTNTVNNVINDADSVLERGQLTNEQDKTSEYQKIDTVECHLDENITTKMKFGDTLSDAVNRFRKIHTEAVELASKVLNINCLSTCEIKQTKERLKQLFESLKKLDCHDFLQLKTQKEELKSIIIIALNDLESFVQKTSDNETEIKVNEILSEIEHSINELKSKQNFDDKSLKEPSTENSNFKQEETSEAISSGISGTKPRAVTENKEQENKTNIKPLGTNENNIRDEAKTDKNYVKIHQQYKKHYEESMTLMAKVVVTENMSLKECKYIEEMLFQKMIDLDKINCTGYNDIKRQRKELINLINSSLDKLEPHIDEQEKDISSRLTSLNKNDDEIIEVSDIKTSENHDDQNIEIESSSLNITDSSNESHQNDNPNIELSKVEKCKDDFEMRSNKGISNVKPEVNEIQNNNSALTKSDDIASSDSSGISENESDNDNDLFSKETVSSVLGYEIPKSGFFTKELDKASHFDLEDNIFDQLYQQKNKRCFKKGTWQSYFVKGLKKSNPFCVFNFKHHHVSTADKYKKNSNQKLFFANASCAFSTCKVQVKLEMFDRKSVRVTYTGNINHDVNEQHCRYIRGNERQELKDEFKGGIKPLVKYLECVNKHTPEELIAGNIDGFGKNTRVLNQIACESRQEGRKSNDQLSSLIALQEDMKKDCENGFIQKISAKPLYVCYWSKNGLLMYHERASSNALFWDATGSVIRRTEDGKQMLYYELAIRHPVKGKMGIPVTSMVSSDQSLPIISDWIKSFRHAEKKQFGYNNIVTPKLIISDQAMVFIMAALQEFNNENVNDFLNRAWEMVNNKSQYDSNKTLVHLCASHFMNTCKKYIEKKIGKGKKSPFLFMIGLLMNCKSLLDAEELLFDIFVLLNSPTLNDVNSEHYGRLKKKINTYETAAENLEATDKNLTDESNDQNTNTNLFTEEEYHAAGTLSKFREWANRISEDAKHITNKIDGNLAVTNRWYSPEFFHYLKNKLMPIFPLWSLILMPLAGFNQDIVKTNSTIENRFRILKHICLNDRSQYRIDEFSDALFKQSVAIQKLSCLESLKFRNTLRYTRKRKIEKAQAGKKVTQETTEPWNKKKRQSLNLIDKQGKYQKPPTTEVGAESPVIQRKFNRKEQSGKHTKTDNDKDSVNIANSSDLPCRTNLQMKSYCSHRYLCTMPNLGNTCWFNSFIQALAASKLSKRIFEKMFSYQSICLDEFESSPKEIALKSICDLLWYMTSEGKGQRVPIDILHTTVRKVVDAISGFKHSEQQDVHEFNTALFSDFCNQLNECIQLTSTSTCSSCNTKTLSNIHEGPSLVFNVLPEVDNITVQTLADNLLMADVRSQECSNCKQNQLHDVKKLIKSSPSSLFVILSRYGNHGNNVQKLHNNIHVSEKLIIPTENGNAEYKLKSIVCHAGENTNSGHYTAVIKTDNGYVCCDDLRLYNVQLDFTLNTAYVIIYDKIDCQIPAFIEPFLECFSKCTGVRELLRDNKVKHLNKSKIAVLKSLVEQGFSQTVEDDLLSLLVPYVENMLKISFQSITVENFYEAFLKYFMYGDSSVGPLLSAEYLEVCSKHIWKCNMCNLMDIENQNQAQLILKEFNLAAIKQSLSQILGNRVLKQCKCNPIERNVIITSVPSMIVIHVKTCHNLINELVESIDLNDVAPSIIQSNSSIFKLGAALCKEGDIYFWAANTSNGIFKIDHGIQSEEKIKLSCMSEVTLFFNKTDGSILTDSYLQKVPPKKFTMKNANKMPEVNKNLPYTKIAVACLNGVKINRKFLSTINDAKMWLTSDNINVYMHLLARDSSKRVHMVDSGWFSHCLLKNSNPERLEMLLTKTESKQSWFDYDLIVIPINESNKHWTLAVVHIKDKTITFMDSYSANSSANLICFQLLRYISYESVMHTGEILDMNHWTISLMNHMKGFPFQTDSSSCGVYVCACARAIMFNTIIPAEPNLYAFRRLMAYEIACGYLH